MSDANLISSAVGALQRMRTLMADEAPAPDASGGVGDINADDYADGSVTVTFAKHFYLAQACVWWLLFGLAVAYAVMKRRVVSRAWTVYSMLLLVVLFNGIQAAAYFAAAMAGQKTTVGVVMFIVNLVFFHLGRSTFLAVLLVVASGYCITRSDFGPYKQQVIFVPVTVLVTGLITGLTFYALQSSPDADTYDLSAMTTLAATLWFVCSVLNLAALILSWMYCFEMLGRELTTLEEDYERLTSKATSSTAPDALPGLGASASSMHGYSTLGGVPSRDAEAARTAAAVAAEEREAETVADRIAYTQKRTLIKRFSWGVMLYLIADICVLLLPIFFNHIVQSTLEVLLFCVYLGFVISLLFLFRPQEVSSYLMVGFSEEDAEERGVNELATGIAMSELPPTRSGGDDSRGSSRRRNGDADGGADSERYNRMPTLATTSADIRDYYGRQPQKRDGGEGGGAGSSSAPALGLPVSSAAAGGSGYGSGPAPAVAVSMGPLYGVPARPTKKYVPLQPGSAGPFTLDDDEEGMPLNKQK